MLTCREVVHLVSSAHERPLSVRERFALSLHLLICRLCRRYARQIDFIARALRQFGAREGDAPGATLDTAARQRIRERLP